MNKKYGINLGYLSLEKDQYKEIKQNFIDDTDSEELLQEILNRHDIEWIYNNLEKKDKEELISNIISNINDLKPEYLRDLKYELTTYHNMIILPTDNLQDLMKAEFILENWDKIKEENINL